MEQNNMETNTNVGIAWSHIHMDDHHAQPRIQCATSVEKLDIGSQDAMEECPRDNNNNPTKEQRKGEVEDQRKLMMLALTKITTSMKSILWVFHNISINSQND